MRIESPIPMKNGGWLHRGEATELRPLPAKPIRVPKIDAAAIFRGFLAETNSDILVKLAAGLGVEVFALNAIGCAWAWGYNAWAFPMRDGAGSIVGIRLRDDTGHKWAITGSKAGLFFAQGECRRLYACEGPTDTAAAISIGLTAVGRPSCLGCEAEVQRVIAMKNAKEVVIVADNDDPGLRGAMKLQSSLTVPSMIWIPPAKDMREFVRLGGSKAIIETLTASTVWTRPRE